MLENEIETLTLAVKVAVADESTVVKLHTYTVNSIIGQMTIVKNELHRMIDSVAKTSMSQRDSFAMAALQTVSHDHSHTSRAKQAYSIADEMLKARGDHTVSLERIKELSAEVVELRSRLVEANGKVGRNG